MNTRQRRLLTVLVSVVVASLLGIGYALLVNNGIGIPCLFHEVTGLRCPGCGISRSLVSLLSLRVDLFLKYNLLSPIIVLYILMVSFIALKNYIQKGKLAYTSPCKWLDISVLALMLLWWVIRNIAGL